MIKDFGDIDAFSTTFNVINAISNISSFKLNHYLKLYQFRTYSIRLLAWRNLVGLSHVRSTDSHSIKLRNIYWVWSASDRRRFDRRSNMSLVSATSIHASKC